MPVKKHVDIEFADEPDEIAYQKRIDLAYDYYLLHLESGDRQSFRKCGRMYGIAWETVRDRAKGAISKELASEAMQRLSALEEATLSRHILQLEAWGWPPLVSQLNKMAVELLRAKGDMDPLGKSWLSSFIRRYPHL